MSTPAPVIALDHPAAFDAARVGRKASALARARAAGLPVGSGVVLTTDWCRDDRATAVQVWRIMSHDGTRPLVVRPSAVGRDRRRAVDVGAVETTVVVRDLDGFLTAVDGVRHPDHTEANLPILVQPHLTGPWRGVLFGTEGRPSRRRRAVVVARRGDDVLAAEWVAELDDAGRVRDVLAGQHDPPVEVLARLTGLAERVADTFDGPHDIEWAVDGLGHVHLLRLRPLVRLCSTTSGTARPAVRCLRPAQAAVPARRRPRPR